MGTKKFKVIIPVAIIFLVIVIALGSVISGYNKAVQMREDVDGYYAQIMNRIQERHDKMGQLVAAVEGLQEYATDVYLMITEARTAYASASSMEEYIQADSLEATALSNFLVVVESNPDVTPTPAYVAYMDEVAATENSLSVARRDYNEAVRYYNAEVRKFPLVLYVNMFGFEKELEYWQLPDGAQEIPIVTFGD